MKKARTEGRDVLREIDTTGSRSLAAPRAFSREAGTDQKPWGGAPSGSLTRDFSETPESAAGPEVPESSLSRGWVGAVSIQRIKIRLKDEDPVLMGRLRDVPMPNEGNQTLDDPAQAGNASEIGVNESIVLEGHGNEDTPLLSFTPRVMKQGGFKPAQLAAIAHSVPKPDKWKGRIILAGCSTGTITKEVSQEYFKLADRAVEVIGTEENIKVGTDATGENFIGSVWEKYPVDQRPGDLAFVREIESANEEFVVAVKGLVRLMKALDKVLSGERVVQQDELIGVDVSALETRARKVSDVDNTSQETQIAQKDYAKQKRDAMWQLFQDAVQEARDIDFFLYPDKVQPVQNTVLEGLQFRWFKDEMVKLSQAGMAKYQEVSFYLLGLGLKRIDLLDKSQATHSKQERTKKSAFGDTWVERAYEESTFDREARLRHEAFTTMEPHELQGFGSKWNDLL